MRRLLVQPQALCGRNLPLAGRRPGGRALRLDEIVEAELRGRRQRLELPLPVLACLGVALGGVPAQRHRGELVPGVVRLGGQEGHHGGGVEAQGGLGGEHHLALQGAPVVGRPAVAGGARQGLAITDNAWGGRGVRAARDCHPTLCRGAEEDVAPSSRPPSTPSVPNLWIES